MNFAYCVAVLENILVENVIVECSDSELCGLVFQHFSKVNIKNSSYSRNKNSSIWVLDDSYLVMENCTIADNDVFYGVIGGWGSVVQITSCIFDNNTGYQSGSVSLIEHSTVLISECTFVGNHGQNGVTVANESTLEISNSTFTNNTAVLSGGAVYAVLYSRLDISKSLFDGNTASFGGAVFIGDNSSIVCTSSNFINNRATTVCGAAIGVYKSNATLSNLVITQNHGIGVLCLYNADFANI